MSTRHTPVLLDEAMEAMALGDGDIVVDATFGGGGYTRAVLARSVAHVFAIDQDPAALAAADVSDPRLTLLEGRFSQMDRLVVACGTATVDAIALDIGVSSRQLDTAERGFSFMADGPLDMRMGKHGFTAADFVNTATEEKIAGVLFRLGDEPKSRQIARAMVHDRPFFRTTELATVVRSVCGRQTGGKDAATRTFQALRMHVNDELGELEAGLAAAERLLRYGGRLAVVTFHSIEDRVVKTFFRVRSGNAPGGSRHQPATKAVAATFTGAVRAVRPSPAEVEHNPRARSATLRAATRTAAPAWGQQ